jgi:hypothetical protein
VTISHHTQHKRLSALFTARAALDAFCTALAARNLKAIKNQSTFDFNDRVWERSRVEVLASLPTASFARHRPNVLQMRFEGSLTEILVEQGETPVTYRCRDENGRILVDDVISPSTGRPESLKASAEVLIPLLCFREALRRSQMDFVRDNSSADFSRLVWNHLDVAPKFDLDTETFFRSPLTRILRTEEGAQIVYGDERFGAQVDLIRHGGHFVVDDVVLVNGPRDQQRIALKKTIRSQLADGKISDPSHSVPDTQEGLFSVDDEQ